MVVFVRSEKCVDEEKKHTTYKALEVVALGFVGMMISFAVAASHIEQALSLQALS